MGMDVAPCACDVCLSEVGQGVVTEQQHTQAKQRMSQAQLGAETVSLSNLPSAVVQAAWDVFNACLQPAINARQMGERHVCHHSNPAQQWAHGWRA